MEKSGSGNEVVLELRDVAKSYESSTAGGTVRVLRDLSLKVQHRDTVAVTGPSGCGKSTLLNLMGALDTPSDGTVLYRGRNLDTMTEPELARIRNQEVGLVFQLHHLLPQCTVLENVLLPTLARARRTSSEAERRAVDLLQRVGLEKRSRFWPSQLSGGERQRVAVVRALINQPSVLLADEPTGSLDEQGAERLVQLLVELNQDLGVTLVMVTHAVALAECMARRYTLHEGRLQEIDVAGGLHRGGER